MMVKALTAGGMTSHVHDSKAKYMEPSEEELRDIYFPLGADGKVVKVLAPWIHLGTLPVARYKIIVMRRDKREVLLSFFNLYNGFLTEGDVHIISNYEEFLEKGISLARNRKDVVSVDIVDYDDILERPLEVFQRLWDSGWPAIPEQAAKIINPATRRQKFTGPPSDDLLAEIGAKQIDLTDAIKLNLIKLPQSAKDAIAEGAEVEILATK